MNRTYEVPKEYINEYVQGLKLKEKEGFWGRLDQMNLHGW